MMRRATIVVTLAFAGSACIIDGVPLPDQTDDARNEDHEAPASDFTDGVNLFATRASGVTLVLGLPASVTGGATIVASSGSAQARTTAVEDGSFNVALAGDLGELINVMVLVAGRETAQAAIETPRASGILVPDGSAVAGDAPLFPSTGTTRIGPGLTNLVLAAGSFAGGVTVAIANVDSGATSVATAAANGSLDVTVEADSGDTLYVVALAPTGASSPYIVTAP